MRICAVGDNVVDRYVDLGLFYPGGNAVNVAVQARRCGAATAYVGVFGDDRAGRVVKEALAHEGVESERVRTVPGHTAYAVVRLRDGERVFEAGSVGVSRFDLTAPDLDYLAGFDLVHTGDCGGLEGGLAQIARRCPVSFDFSDRGRAYAAPLLPHVRIATFSASGLTDREVRELIDWAHRIGPRYVLVTRGRAGCVISDGLRQSWEPASPGPVVDTLGAGDAFIARALVGILSGADPDGIARAAAVHAARCCAAHGAFGHGAPDVPEPAGERPVALPLPSSQSNIQ